LFPLSSTWNSDTRNTREGVTKVPNDLCSPHSIWAHIRRSLLPVRRRLLTLPTQLVTQKLQLVTASMKIFRRSFCHKFTPLY
jgi:hypothetical protein